MKKIAKILLFILLLPLGLVAAKIATIGKKIQTESLQPYLLTDEKEEKDLKIGFFGTSCFSFSYNGSTFVLDPFFSNPNAIELINGELPDKRSFAKELIDDLDSISMIAVSHGHYDHCLDLAAFLPKTNSQSKLVADKSICNELHPITKNQKNLQVKDISPSQNSEWNYSADSIFRLKAFESVHTEHVWKFKFFQGSYDAPLSELPGPVWEWKEGNTYCFLLDIMDKNEIKHRFLLSGGDVKPKVVEEIKAALEGKEIDIIFQPYWHHKKSGIGLYLVQEVFQPKKVILHHWNNFFRAPESSLQSMRSSRLEKTLQNSRTEGHPFYVMLPFSKVEL